MPHPSPPGNYFQTNQFHSATTAGPTKKQQPFKTVKQMADIWYFSVTPCQQIKNSVSPHPSLVHRLFFEKCERPQIHNEELDLHFFCTDLL